MADFSISKLISKIAEYDKLGKDNTDIDALVEYNVLGKKSKTSICQPEEDIIKTCSAIKEYLNKVLKNP